jgi:CBS domain-containing protein
MQVNEIMSREVCCGSPWTNAAVAAELMWTNNVGSLPIVEVGGKIVGVVTDRDLFIALGTQNRRPSELTMGEVMRREPTICAPADDLRSALKLMGECHAHRLPVAEEGILKGMLSIDDIVREAGPECRDEILGTLTSLSEAQTVVKL